MINILVYNSQSGRMEWYARELSAPMPYALTGTLSVREFRGKSNSELIWTDRRAMEAWNTTRRAWGRPIYVGYAFRRIGEGGHADMSQHYAGVSFDVGQNLNTSERRQLRSLASSLGVWGYVEPESLTPTWVHFDRRTGVPACARGGYPVLSQGVIGVYVALLQDALGTVGIPSVGVDGVFGPNTRNAVMRFQRENGLGADGVVGCATWTRLTSMANGKFRNTSVIPPQYAGE